MQKTTHRSLSEVEGSTISVHNANYTVKTRVPGKLLAKKDKRILIDISAIFKPGMNAILGPTGSGKSSLLDILAGRKDPHGLSGTLLVDGSRQPKNYKCMTGYVVQDDVVMGTLSVRENLSFSANLRLPPTVTEEEKAARVEDTLKELGLERCADSKVGNQFIRGVSGGERKRTSIGMELIISPTVLFLDEPTTGLDATTANSVMRLLKRLSLRGRTIIFSIHQPRFTIFRQFDHLTLLSLGRMVYHGRADASLDYFAEHGYICEEHNNPPDFFLDVLQGDRKPTLPTSNTATTNGSVTTVTADGSVVTSFSTTNGTDMKPVAVQLTVDDSDDDEPSKISLDEHAVQMSKYFTNSQAGDNIRAEISAVYEQYQKKIAGGKEDIRVVGEYATSYLTQTRIVAKRAIKNVFRNPQTSFMQMGMTMAMGLLTGIIYLQLDNNLPSGIQNRAGAFFFTTMNMVFSSMSGVAIFIEERAIFVHENISGFYRVSSYFTAKVLCDMLPMRLIPVCIYSVLSYFLVGYQLVAGKFFIYLLTAFMTNFVAASMAFFASGVSPIFAVANLFGILMSILMMIFGGLLVNLDSLGAWISWVKYLSLFRYCINALNINELKDMVFCDSVNNTEICAPGAGNIYMEQQGIPYRTTWDLWLNHVALAGMATVFLILAYILLRTMKKLK